MATRLTAEDLEEIRQDCEAASQSLAGNVILRFVAEIDALITERDSARLQLASCQDALQEVMAELRQVGTSLGGEGNTRPAVDLAAEARLALDLNETVQKQLIAERDEALARLEEYRRPEHWPEGSQMRHVRDLEMVLAVSHRREAEADKELARLRPVVAAVRGWACQTDVYLAACNRDTEVGWQEEGRRLDAAVTVLRAALNAADKDKEASDAVD